MSVVHDNVLLGSSGSGGGYQISRSVRLRSSASAYFSRTPASAGNRTTWTMSLWCKRGAIGAINQNLFSAAGYDIVRFSATYPDTIEWEPSNLAGYAYTTAVFRDPSAWYHLVFVWDSTNATAANRMRLYVNNVLQTFNYTIGAPAQNTQSYWNAAVASTIGTFYSPTQFLDGYLTEINFIDGQALTPSSFGTTDAITGVWRPKKYSGSYGTNGFYLNFSDNSAATATTIGKDSSGNGNNWTPSNISVTAGVTYDSMIDSPTAYVDGGNGRGNYCVLNPLAVTTYPGVLSEGNLKTTTPTTGGGNTYGTIALPASGKYYWEVLCLNANSGSLVGVASYNPAETYLFNNTNCVQLYATGQKYVDGAASAYGSAMGSSATIGVAADCDTGSVTFYINNVSQGAISHAMSGLFPVFSDGASATGEVATFNFGQRPFTYTPPSGFKALNTYNLPTPTITNGSKHMLAYTNGGNGSTRNDVIGFQPDFIWTKTRNTATNGDHIFQDAVRGAGYKLVSNSTAAEGAYDSTLGSFTSTGFQFGTNAFVNTNGNTYVNWAWKAGNATSSNTSGTITSTVSVNATAGFSVVTYTATGANATVGHGLGVAPSMIIYKARSGGAGSWTVGHKNMASSNPWNSVIFLDLTNAAAASGGGFNNTAPTSSVFSIGGAYNPSTWTMVAYCWSEIAGFSKFGSYTGNGSTDGPFVYCGFRPRYVLMKRTDSSTNGYWIVIDTARNTYNASGSELFPNGADAEYNGGRNIDVLSNGFKLRDNAYCNVSGGTYIYAAFAENPFKNSLAR